MSLIDAGRLGTGPRELQQQAQIDRIIAFANGDIEIGDPQDPFNTTSAAILAGATNTTGAHNGTIVNLAGSWVEISLTSTGITNATCYHNLYPDSADTSVWTVPVTGEPNCRWAIKGKMHDGTSDDGTSFYDVDVMFIGGTVAVNAIDLRFNLILGGTSITVGGDNPVLVTLWFTRATRGE